MYLDDRASQYGEDCTSDSAICTDGLTCLSNTKKCGCDIVNDANSILHPRLADCVGKVPYPHPFQHYCSQYLCLVICIIQNYDSG